MSKFIKSPNGERALVGGTDKEEQIKADKPKATSIKMEGEKLAEKLRSASKLEDESKNEQEVNSLVLNPTPS